LLAVRPGSATGGADHADAPASQKLYPYHDSPFLLCI
jgi:hypothetical protein